MTLTDWASLLLADCSDVNLLGFADWLELDQDDEALAKAARGVRGLLVAEGRRPYRSSTATYAWTLVLGSAVYQYDLSQEFFKNLEKFASKQFLCRWYDFTPATQATAHLTALLDAAQAWGKCNPEKKEVAA